jgi:DNA-binding CsgD family transcriptional regulator
LPHRLLIAVDSLCAGTPTKVTGVVTLRGTYVSEPVVRLRSIRKWVESLMLAHQGGVALAPSVAIRVADRLKQSPLTQRERDRLAQMILGLSNKVIALRLTVSIGTVKTHVKSILEKLQAVGRAQAVAIAQERGLLAPDTGVFRRMPTLRGQNLIRATSTPSWSDYERIELSDARPTLIVTECWQSLQPSRVAHSGHNT